MENTVASAKKTRDYLFLRRQRALSWRTGCPLAADCDLNCQDCRVAADTRLSHAHHMRNKSVLRGLVFKPEEA
ncbi:MAG: hypothetical protein PHP45_01885 [Elusimicrobiales bacterium]|nr:hypothetical protein [Elusimicrobiales bacterium]